jgi:hypothetical protein
MLEWIKQLLRIKAADAAPKMALFLVVVPGCQLRRLPIGRGRDAKGKWRGWKIILSVPCCRMCRWRTISMN